MSFLATGYVETAGPAAAPTGGGTILAKDCLPATTTTCCLVCRMGSGHCRWPLYKRCRTSMAHSVDALVVEAVLVGQGIRLGNSGRGADAPIRITGQLCAGYPPP